QVTFTEPALAFARKVGVRRIGAERKLAFLGGGVDGISKIFRFRPVPVLEYRAEDVVAAHAARTVTTEEKRLPVRREEHAGLVVRGIHARAQVHRFLPFMFVLAPYHPDVA